MGQYKEDSKELLHLVGGKENLSIQPQYMPSFALSMLVPSWFPLYSPPLSARRREWGRLLWQQRRV